MTPEERAQKIIEGLDHDELGSLQFVIAEAIRTQPVWAVADIMAGGVILSFSLSDLVDPKYKRARA